MFQQIIHKRFIRLLLLIVRIVQAYIFLTRQIIIDILRQKHKLCLIHTAIAQSAIYAVKLPKKLLHLQIGKLPAAIQTFQCSAGTDIIVKEGRTIYIPQRTAQNILQLSHGKQPARIALFRLRQTAW